MLAPATSSVHGRFVLASRQKINPASKTTVALLAYRKNSSYSGKESKDKTNLEVLSK